MLNFLDFLNSTAIIPIKRPSRSSIVNKIRDIVKEIFKSQNEIKVNTPPREYIVGYYEYYNDSWEGDTIEVKASTEEEAIEKAKKLVPRATKGFKAKLK